MSGDNGESVRTRPEQSLAVDTNLIPEKIVPEEAPKSNTANLEDKSDIEKVDYVPAAIPQEREVVQSKSYFAHKLACVTFVLVAIIAVVGGVCGSGHCNSGTGDTVVAVTSAPTTYRSSFLVELESKLMDAFGDDYLTEDGNDLIEVRKRAIEWILNEDPLQLELDADNLIQRYILTLFYFQTSQDSPWIECDPSGTPLCYPRTVSAGYTANPENPWLSDNHECSWALVECGGDSGGGKRNVTSIYLLYNGLNGPIPTELAKLTHLMELTLSNHQLTGTIPTELAELTQLEALFLHNNTLTGTIPPELFENIPTLEHFAVSRNSLTGSIPTAIQFFHGMRMSIHSNDLTGTIPTELFGISSIKFLLISHNDFTGTISPYIGNMSNLSYADLEGTLLSGEIPSEIGLLTSLTSLSLENTNMVGTLPEELFQVTTLTHLQLTGCGFSGTISTNVGLLSDISWILLADNNFVGEIPIEIEGLMKLSSFTVQGNGFTGTFPESVCSDGFVDYSYSFVADCLPDEDTGVPTMECACCTECCNAKNGICREL